jgi:hypothetical protein
MDEYRAENAPGTTAQSDSGAMLRNGLEQRLRSGASWFYWIAGLSIINMIVLHTGGDWSFIIGLGIAFLIGAASEIIGVLNSIIFSILVSGLFAVFGYAANKGKLWGFIVGLTIYALDTLIYLLVQDWASVGFHIFAWIMIFLGLRAALQLRKM